MRVGAAKFREWCRLARILWPLDKPVTVRRVHSRDIGGACGECGETDDGYYIKIARDQCRAAISDALVHEWCHLRRHEFDEDPEGLHDDTFWLEFGSMYRAWHTTS